MDDKSDSGWKIQDNWCGRIMAMLNLKLLKDEATYEAYDTENGTATDEDTNYGSTLLK